MIRSRHSRRNLSQRTEALRDGAEIVIAKAGAKGAWLFQSGQSHQVPAFHSKSVWKIGSGDIFTAAFAAAWGIDQADPLEAARLASRAVAEYVNSKALPIRPSSDLAGSALPEVATQEGEVYLAGPFFNMPQRWLVDEARRCLRDVGLTVFSPIHDVGIGPADDVAPKDIEALKRCDLVFAIIDGIDAGTVFEIGYARALGKPVYIFSQVTTVGDLTMMIGTDCHIHNDFTTAIHHAAWRT
jgi:nucleoside 2-deoxyribosyltransferase